MMLNLLSAVACVIIFANDMGSAVTREIHDHELAHCAGWKHPAGLDSQRGFGKAYLPPRNLVHAFKGKVYEQSVSTSEARDRCDGMLGCSRVFEDD